MRTDMSTLKAALMREDFPEPLCDYEWQYQFDLGFSFVSHIITFPTTRILNLWTVGSAVYIPKTGPHTAGFQ